MCLPDSCNLTSPSKGKNEMLRIRQGHAQHLPAKWQKCANLALRAVLQTSLVPCSLLHSVHYAVSVNHSHSNSVVSLLLALTGAQRKSLREVAARREARIQFFFFEHCIDFSIAKHYAPCPAVIMVSESCVLPLNHLLLRTRFRYLGA